jgi:hypothetical protein
LRSSEGAEPKLLLPRPAKGLRIELAKSTMASVLPCAAGRIRDDEFLEGWREFIEFFL